MIKNIVIGKPIVHPKYIFCKEEDEWTLEEKETLFTEERFLPRIMVDLGIAKSISEVKRNKKELFISLDTLDYKEVKWGKHRLFILVGE